MSPFHDSSFDVRIGTFKNWLKLLPETCVACSLLGAAKLVSLGQYCSSLSGCREFLSLVVFALWLAAFCVGVHILLRIARPNLKGNPSWRFLSTVSFASIAVKIGFRYIHMCEAGSRWIEGMAVLGTPILVGSIVFAFNGRLRGFVLASCVLIVVWFLARPYIDLAHGS